MVRFGLNMEIAQLSGDASHHVASFSDWLVLWMVLWGTVLHAMLAMWLLWRVCCHNPVKEDLHPTPVLTRTQEGRRWTEGFNGIYLRREELTPRETQGGKGLAGLIRRRRHRY